MKQFQIQNIKFSIGQNEVQHEDQKYSINDKTLKTLLMFLESNQKVITKDELIEIVWEGIIVSDASVFKQIQVARSLLSNLGLADDIIENVYGKGYRLKYPLEVISKNTSPSSYKHQINRIWFVAILSSILLVSYFYIKGVNKPDLLNLEQRKSLVTLSKNDWEKGLIHIHQLLENETDYSLSDRAFLNQQKGQAHLSLQQHDAAKRVLNQSLNQYQKLNDNKGQGEVELLISRIYDYIDNPVAQKQHINNAIGLFQKAEAHQQTIDALMDLAYYQKKSGAIAESIITYEQAILKAKETGDTVGQVIGINNLAATYLIQNNNTKATELAEEGLEISVSTGNGQHIANSYSFLSQLYWQQGQKKKSIKMISESIKFQLETNNHRHLSPKLMNLNFFLVETAQFSIAEKLLETTDAYAKALNVKGGSVVIGLYKGMNAAHQGQWQKALLTLSNAYETALKKNFKYKKPDTMAYLAVTLSNTGNHIKALELAQELLTEKSINNKHKKMAYLTLALSNWYLERSETSSEWLEKADEIEIKNWVFEDYFTQVMVHKMTEPEELLESNSNNDQLIHVKSEINNFAEQNVFDLELINQMMTQVQELTKQKLKKAQ